MLKDEEGVLGKRCEGTPSKDATLLTAATEVRGKALEKRLLAQALQSHSLDHYLGEEVLLELGKV